MELKNGTQQKDTEEKEKGIEEIEEKKLGMEKEIKPGEKVKGKNKIEEMEKTNTFTEEKNKAVEEEMDRKKKHERNLRALRGIMERMKIKPMNMEDPEKEVDQKESIFSQLTHRDIASGSSETTKKEDIERQITNEERLEIEKTVTYLGARHSYQ